MSEPNRQVAKDREWWLCGECFHVAPSDTWGIEDGNCDTAVCPGCGFAHHDDECSWVEAGAEIEMHRRARTEREAAARV